ncbi:NAD(P)-binding protein [Halomarina salina]|uniref:NAD(P)-binding protein n=1 Tax=Halomarina salina TaxID=1872699 RepID=A0ABD5RLE5_9EURY|nr:NAD(P)-binding protein [Halomarina salina]
MTTSTPPSTRRASVPAGSPERARTIHVVGGGRVGRALADRLRSDGNWASLVDDTPDVVTESMAAGIPVVEGDPMDSDVLERAGLADADAVVAATTSDGSNLLIAQLARARFGVETVVVRVNDPDHVETFRPLDYETVCTTSNVEDGIASRLR